MNVLFNSKYITTKEASARYNYSISWFKLKRNKKNGPPYMKLNGKIFYDLAKTDEWFKNHIEEY